MTDKQDLPLAGIPRRRVHAHGDGSRCRADAGRSGRRHHSALNRPRATTRGACRAPVPDISQCTTATNAALCVDLKSDAGRELVLKLCDKADVVIENFRPGTMDRLGFGYEALKARNPSVIYCSEKGFLSGPYEQRTALDEVAQMMGGPRVYDRTTRDTAASGHFCYRRAGRYVRRARHNRGVIPAQCDRQRSASGCIAVREHGIPRRSAHGAVCGDGQGGRSDACARVGLGDLPGIRDR